MGGVAPVACLAVFQVQALFDDPHGFCLSGCPLPACLLPACLFSIPNALRVLTFTYVALLFGLMGYRIVFQGAEGLRSRNNILFLTNVVTMLFPYICISLYTADKRIYLADTSAKRYRPSAYYAAKV